MKNNIRSFMWGFISSMIIIFTLILVCTFNNVYTIDNNVQEHTIDKVKFIEGKYYLITVDTLSNIIVDISIKSGYKYNKQDELFYKEDLFLESLYKYKTDKNQKRKWNREIYYSDFDSVTISKWKILSKEEKVKLVEEVFIFDMDSTTLAEWNTYSIVIKYRCLFNNTFVMFDK